MRIKKAECQNNECKFHKTNKKKGLDKRKRVGNFFLEGHSFASVKCPVCYQEIDLHPDEDMKGIVLYGMDEDSLGKALETLNKYAFQEPEVRTLLDAVEKSVVLWQKAPKQKDEIVLDKSAKDVLNLVTEKVRHATQVPL